MEMLVGVFLGLWSLWMPVKLKCLLVFAVVLVLLWVSVLLALGEINFFTVIKKTYVFSKD